MRSIYLKPWTRQFILAHFLEHRCLQTDTTLENRAGLPFLLLKEVTVYNTAKDFWIQPVFHDMVLTFCHH